VSSPQVFRFKKEPGKARNAAASNGPVGRLLYLLKLLACRGLSRCHCICSAAARLSRPLPPGKVAL